MRSFTLASASTAASFADTAPPELARMAANSAWTAALKAAFLLLPAPAEATGAGAAGAGGGAIAGAGPAPAAVAGSEGAAEEPGAGRTGAGAGGGLLGAGAAAPGCHAEPTDALIWRSMPSITGRSIAPKGELRNRSGS